MRFPGGVRKALTLSYDDGVEQDIKLVGILDKHGLKCTFNLNGGCFAPEDKVYPEGTIHRRMKKASCVELYKNGPHEVAVHAYTHPFLERLPSAQVAYEIIKDREELEATFGGIVRGMAYPYGRYNDTVINAVSNAGIVYSRTCNSTGQFKKPVNYLEWNPTCHHNKVSDYINVFISSAKSSWCSRIFYVWGHSYEFDIYPERWELFDEFCRLISNRSDIFYGTNKDVLIGG